MIVAVTNIPMEFAYNTVSVLAQAAPIVLETIQ